MKGGHHAAQVNISKLSDHISHAAEAWGETIGTGAHSLEHVLHHSQGPLHAMAEHLPQIAHFGHGLADFAPAAQLVPYGAKFVNLAGDIGLGPALGTAVKSIFS